MEKENEIYYIQNVLCQGYCFIIVMTEVGRGRGGGGGGASTISSV